MSTANAVRLTPPAPAPLAGPPDLFAFLRLARTNPLMTWTRAHFEQPIVYGKGAIGRLMVLNDPAAIRHVLVDNAGNYRKDDLQRRVLVTGDAEGLLTAEGEEWRLLRRTLAPLFSPRNVSGFLSVMDESACRLTARLSRREGRERDIALDMTRVTLDVLERTIFTQGLASDPAALGNAITRFLEAVGPIDPLDVFAMPDWIPRIGRLRARPAIRFLEEVVDRLIRDRKALLDAGAPPPVDLLTLLLAARDPETGQPLPDLVVRANIVTFIGAGHETTANTLAWALFLISQDDTVRARLEDEIDSVMADLPADASLAKGHLDRLVFTRAVIEETMRLYPAVPFMSRETIAEDRIAGIRVPPRTMVTIAPWVLHRHKMLWRDPAMFDPDRFMPPQRDGIDRFAYLPFGAGPRICIGQSFSMQEMIIVLARLLHALRFELKPGHVVVPLHRITLRPQGGVPMRVTRRR